MKPEHLHLHPRSCEETTHAIVDRPAPTPAVAPGLDLDAVERAERAMTPGPWRHGSVERHHVFCSEGDRSLLCPEAGRVLLRMNEHFPHDSDAAGIVALRNAAPALIAEVRALRAEVERLRADKAEAKRLGSYLATYITAMNDAEHPSGGFGLDELAEQTAAALEAL